MYVGGMTAVEREKWIYWEYERKSRWPFNKQSGRNKYIN